jgi:hypothetical protein
MSTHNRIKPELLNELWLPGLTKCGKIFYPRKKYKEMSVLTLTSTDNFDEIDALIEKNLTRKELIKVLTNTHVKVARLETEIGKSKIFGPGRYEDIMSNGTCELIECFPFDVLNLDFFSQDPRIENGRIEDELLSIEKTIRLQKVKNHRMFALIYTSILNSHNLDLTRIKNISDYFSEPGWGGILISQYPDIVQQNDQKINCIEYILSGLSQKYNYPYTHEIKIVDIERNRIAFSIMNVFGVKNMD